MAVTFEQLGTKDADLLRDFLSRDPIQNLYMLGLFEEFGIAARPGQPPFQFWGRFSGRELTAAVFVGGWGGLVVPCANAPLEVAQVAQQLVGRVQVRSCLGSKAAVDAVMRTLGPAKPKHAWVQRLFSVSADDLGPFTNPTLRVAREEELNRILPLAVGWVKETLGRDPMAEDPEGFRDRVLQRIRGKRTYVLESNGKIALKIDVGSRSQFGAELEGLYTAPEERRHGHATLSLGQISRHLLASLPRLTLRADDKDPALAGVARKVGYVSGAQQRLVVAV
jgi:hypothetical protein